MNDILPFANLPRGLAPLGYRDFFLYWVGLLTTTIGRWVELTGVLWLVYELTDSPFLVGMLGMARAIPSLLLSPVAGVVSDRVNSRVLLFICQLMAMAAALCLGILIVVGALELWHIYLQVMVQAIVQTFDSAARQTLYPRLVPRPLLARAVTLGVSATRVSKFLGPALGGFLIASSGESAPFFFNSLSYLGLMFALAAMHLTIIANVPKTSLAADFMEGIRYILTTPVMRGLLQLEIVFGLFELNPTMIAILGREFLSVGPQALGFLLAAPAFGSMVAIVWMLAAQRGVHSGRFSILCALMYACVLGFLPLSWNYSITIIVLSIVGVLEVLMTVNRASIMQLSAPEHMRGRIMSNIGVVTRGISPLSETQSGVLASLIGPTFGILTAAATIATAAGLIALYNRALWTFSLNSRP